MAPPPESGYATNKNDDDPLGGMDPMAWLESLAARKGANPDELTTEANLEIEEPPADTVVDEPGYTPGYDVGKSSFAAQSESAKVAPEPEPAPEPAYDFAPANEPEPAAPEPVASTSSADDPLGGMDTLVEQGHLAVLTDPQRFDIT